MGAGGGARRQLNFHLAARPQLVDTVDHHLVAGRQSFIDRRHVALRRADRDLARLDRAVLPHGVDERALRTLLNRRHRHQGRIAFGPNQKLHVHTDPFFTNFAAHALRGALRLPTKPTWDPLYSRGELLETLDVIQKRKKE